MAESHGSEQFRIALPSLEGDLPGEEISEQPGAASAASARVTADIDLAACWRELVGGLSTVRGSFFDGARCGLLLAAAEPLQDFPLTGRRLEVIESVLCGVGQNCLAIDLRLAPSTVALNARRALECLGVSARPSRVHPLLMLIATAARRRLSVTGSLSFAQSERGEVRVIEISRPGQVLLPRLPTAERKVIELLVEGHCYSEISLRRNAAERTVANQIAAVFRRFNVSGRSELIQRLFEADGLIPPSPRPGSQPTPAAAPTLVPTTMPPPTFREPLSRPPRDDARTSQIRPLSSLSKHLLEQAASRSSAG